MSRILQIVLMFSCHMEYISCMCSVGKSGATCTFFTEVNAYGSQKWQQVTVNNTDKRPLEILASNTFTKVPNVKNLTIDGYINGIKTGAFTGLRNVILLRFLNNPMRELQPNVFANLRVERILFRNCELQTLNSNCFSNAINLKSLIIENNPLRMVKTGVFNHLNLEKLHLLEDEISVIEDGAFSNMNQLQELNLRGNYLNIFESKRMIGFNPTLSMFFLSNNQIARVTRSMFDGLPNIRTINLSQNQIELIEENSFSGVKSIETIILNNNRLEVILPSIFPSEGLLKIKSVEVRKNRLTYLNPAVLDRLPTLKNFCFAGNPMQCGCHAELVKWINSKDVSCLKDSQEYYTGKRPLCIMTSQGSHQCLYGPDYSIDTQQLVQHYLSELSTYPEHD